MGGDPLSPSSRQREAFLLLVVHCLADHDHESLQDTLQALCHAHENGYRVFVDELTDTQLEVTVWSRSSDDLAMLGNMAFTLHEMLSGLNSKLTPPEGYVTLAVRALQQARCHRGPDPSNN